MTEHRTTDELKTALAYVTSAPSDRGTVRMIVRRPDVDERDVVDEATLSPEAGLVGDTWASRQSSSSADGGPHPGTQLTLMNARFADVIAGERSRWPLAGDQLYVDLDVSEDNLPVGTRLSIGSAVIEISDQAHTGCAKFSRRFGLDALRFANSPDGRRHRLRGVYARVVAQGIVHVGDVVTRV